MTAPDVPRVEIAPGYSIARVINGGWQLAPGHGTAAGSREERLRALESLAARGFTTFDCADIYTGVEELLGELLRRWRTRRSTPPLQIHTKYVPDLASLGSLDRRSVAAGIERSLRRLGVERIDCVQFHWWDYRVPGYVETALHLDELRRQGKIRLLGATNFDRRRLAEMLEAGARISALQLQYSLLDRRPRHGMARFCAERGIALLAYGTLAGGFLGAPWLDAAATPPREQRNRSLTKYRLIIEEFGGWERYQELLRRAAGIARRHGVSVANVASRWVLDRDGVAAVILGAASARHLEENLRLFAFEPDREDERQLEELLRRAPGPGGDVYELERQAGGRHRAILRTDLRAGKVDRREPRQP